MSFKIYFAAILSVFLFISCEKSAPPRADVQSPEDPEKEETKEHELSSGSMVFNDLLTDRESAGNIYIGQVVDYQEKDNSLQLEDLTEKYKVLPITISSQPFLRSKTVVPDRSAMEEYLKGFESSEGSSNSVTGSSWREFIDYREMLIFMLKTNKDFIEFSKLVSTENSTKISRKTGLYTFSKALTHSLYMDLPNKDDLISKEDQDRLVEEGKNPYYVNQVSYGKIMLLFVESDSSSSALKTTLDNVFADDPASSLTANDLKVLENTQLSVYFRTGKLRPLLKKAFGKDNILQLIQEINKEDQDHKSTFDNPLYYSLRNLKDFSPLNYTSEFDYYRLVDKQQ